MTLKVLILLVAVFSKLGLVKLQESSLLNLNNVTIVKVRENCFCALYTDPICANDGGSYINDCFLNCWRNYNPSLLGLCHGECPCCKPVYQNPPLIDNGGGWGWAQPQLIKYRVDPEHLPAENVWSGDTVPLLNGGVSKNVRSLEDGDKSESLKLGWSPSNGSERCLCTELYMPVCGSNNQTYYNLCQFKCASKKDKCLTQSCDGECPCCNCKRPSLCQPEKR